MLRVLIVDDEPLARARLRTLLAADRELTVVGECGNGPDAVAAIATVTPDLVLLDIQMPGFDGLEVVRRVGIDRMPAVVFVTAHNDYAVEAFAAHAVDYVLKPVDCQRFDEALHRAKLRAASTALVRSPANDSPVPLLTSRARLAALLAHLAKDTASAPPLPPVSAALSPPAAPSLQIKVDGRLLFVRVSDIDWLEADDNHVYIHAGGRTHVVRETLAHLTQRLPANGFLRIHRSSAINVDRIRELRWKGGGSFTVVLTDGTAVAGGKRYRDVIEAYLRTQTKRTPRG